MRESSRDRMGRPVWPTPWGGVYCSLKASVWGHLKGMTWGKRDHNSPCSAFIRRLFSTPMPHMHVCTRHILRLPLQVTAQLLTNAHFILKASTNYVCASFVCSLASTCVLYFIVSLPVMKNVLLCTPLKDFTLYTCTKLMSLFCSLYTTHTVIY